MRRRGFTLIELLIALVLVGLGLVALTATGALVAREMRAALSRTEAAVAARNRVEEFLARCVKRETAGTGVGAHGVRERWSVAIDSPLARLTDSVTYREYDRERSLAVVVSRSC